MTHDREPFIQDEKKDNKKGAFAIGLCYSTAPCGLKKKNKKSKKWIFILRLNRTQGPHTDEIYIYTQLILTFIEKNKKISVQML